MFAVIALLVPATLGFGIAWALQQERGKVWAIAGMLLLALLPGTMLLRPWPLDAAFLVSKNSLQELVADVRAGEPPTLPCRAGVFRVTAIATQNDTVALITDNNSAGRSALVCFESGLSGDAYRYHGPMYNLNWDHALSRDWRYQNED